MTDAPSKIYLQHDPEQTGEPFGAAHEVTWCHDMINENDIAYVRADSMIAECKRILLYEAGEDHRNFATRVAAKFDALAAGSDRP